MVPSCCCCSLAFRTAGLGEGPGYLCWAGGPGRASLSSPGSILMVGGVGRGPGASWGAPQVLLEMNSFSTRPFSLRRVGPLGPAWPPQPNTESSLPGL